MPFRDVVNLHVARLLSYLMLSTGAPAHVRRVAIRHEYPQPTEDFVRDVQVQAVANVRRRFRAELADPAADLFVNERHVAGTGNGFLQNAFLQVRAAMSGPVEIPAEPAGHLDDERDGGDECPDDPLVLGSGECGGVRFAITLLAANGEIACWHAADGERPCPHHGGSCPNRAVVLSVALQLVALREGAQPPVDEPEATAGVMSERDLKYAMVAVAAPGRVPPAGRAHDGARPAAAGGARQVVRRCWHCAVNLILKARGTL